MPTLVPVYRQLRYGDPLKSRTGGLSEQRIPDKMSSAHLKQPSTDGGSFERLHNADTTFSSVDHRYNVKISSGRKGSSLEDTDGESYPMDGVMVTQRIVWAEHNQGHNAV